MLPGAEELLLLLISGTNELLLEGMGTTAGTGVEELVELDGGAGLVVLDAVAFMPGDPGAAAVALLASGAGTGAGDVEFESAGL